MADPFADLATAFGDWTGMGTDLAGYVLGSVLTVCLLVALQWAIGGKEMKGNNFVFLVSAGLGVTISTLVGWFDVWVVIFIGLILAFIIVNPLGGRNSE